MCEYWDEECVIVYKFEKVQVFVFSYFSKEAKDDIAAFRADSISTPSHRIVFSNIDFAFSLRPIASYTDPIHHITSQRENTFIAFSKYCKEDRNSERR
jgi:hypothetical protein